LCEANSRRITPRSRATSCRGNRKPHGGEPAAGAAAEFERARASRQRAEPVALPVEHLDLPDMAIGIRIKFDLGFARRGVLRHIDDAGGAADAEIGGRRRDRRRRGLISCKLSSLPGGPCAPARPASS
jgi:hypothetical protein